MIEFKCPKCGTTPKGCSGKAKDACCDRNFGAGRSTCGGFVCECDEGHDDTEHGESFASVCHYARCYHCGHDGRFPVKPNGLQAWERKALDAGWVPPAARASELGFNADKKPEVKP